MSSNDSKSKYAHIIEAIRSYELLALASKTYGPYSVSPVGRKIVIIKDDLGNTRTVSWPKYLMEQHLGVQLDPDQTIDHWDSDINNNDINNLRVVPRKEHSADDTRRVKLVKFNCSWCKKEFERSPRLVRDKSKKGRRGIFCSRQCAGKYSRNLQLKLIDKFPVQPYIESEYYKRKYVKSTIIEYLLKKYG